MAASFHQPQTVNPQVFELIGKKPGFKPNPLPARLGSVGQDTFLCLWELTEDIIRQGLRFSSHYHQSAATNRNYQASTSSSGICGDGAGGEGASDRSRTSTVPRSSGSGGKKKHFLSSFRSPLPHSSRASEHGDASGKSSILSDSGCLSASGEHRLLEGLNGIMLPHMPLKE